MPALRTGSAIITTGSGTAQDLLLPVPAGTQLGDLLGVWCYSGAAGRTWTTPGSPVNWTATSATAGPNNSAQYFTATADPTVIGGTVDFHMSVAGQWGAIVVALSSPMVPPYDPVAPGNGGTAGTGTVIDGGTLVTTLPGDLLLWFGANQNAAGTTPGVIAVPPGFSAPLAQANSSGPSGRTIGLLLGENLQSLPGSTGDAAGTSTLASANMGLLVAVSSFDAAADDDVFRGFDAGETIVVIPPGAPTRAQPGATWLNHFKPSIRLLRNPPPQSVPPILPIADGDTGSGGDTLIVALSSGDVSRKPTAGQNIVTDSDAIAVTDGKPNTGTIAKTGTDTLHGHDGK